MFSYFCGLFAVLICIFSHFSLSAVLPNNGIVAICPNKTLNLTYDPPLPAAGGTPVQTQEIQNRGVWLCQVEGININVTYYVSLILTDATCEHATFSKFLVYGNADPLDTHVVPWIFNLTVNFTDAKNSRQLNQLQQFNSTLEAENTVPAVPANSTAIFPPEKHQSGTCGPISNEIVGYTVYAYVSLKLTTG